MKRVLITGAGSYVGGWVRRRLEREPDEFTVEELDVQGDAWRSFEFSGWDVVFHVAGVAHVKETPDMAPLYYRVNRDLAIEVGKRAKTAGVGQFIFMSTAAVYGDGSNSNVEGIGPETPTAPVSAYGKSKLEAEDGLKALESDSFRVTILRCPMIYGPGCPGNFATLAKIAAKTPIFPSVKNKRSVLYIENLSEFIAQAIKKNISGMYWPQNAEFMSTSDAVARINKSIGGRVRLTKLLNLLVYLAMKFTSSGRKAFGSFYYRKQEESLFTYQIKSFADSIDEMSSLKKI